MPNGYWENAINGNSTVGSLATLAGNGYADPSTAFQGSLATFLSLVGSPSDLTPYVGDWGYDPTGRRRLSGRL